MTIARRTTQPRRHSTRLRFTDSEWARLRLRARENGLAVATQARLDVIASCDTTPGEAVDRVLDGDRMP